MEHLNVTLNFLMFLAGFALMYYSLTTPGVQVLENLIGGALLGWPIGQVIGFLIINWRDK